MMDEDPRRDMMRKDFLAVFAVLFILCFIPGCLDNGGNGDDDPEKEAALEFGLKVVQTYFSNDMEKFKSYLDDEVFILDGDGPFSRADAISFLDDADHVASEDYLDHNYQEYLETYDPFVLNVDEVEDEFEGMVDIMIALGWDYDHDDYLFIGFETRSGNEEDGFLWDIPLIFGITNEDGYWTFKAFSS